MKEIIELSSSFRLKKANMKEFFIFWAIYDQENYLQGINSKIKPLNTSKDNCFWIYQENKKIGGVTIEPNLIHRFFVIPPFSDLFTLLKALNNYLLEISDMEKPIKIITWENQYNDLIFMLGYSILEIKRWMIRPTEKLAVSWHSSLETRQLTKEDLEKMIELFVSANEGTFEERLFYKFHKNGDPIKSFREEFTTVFEGNEHFQSCLNSSLVVFDRETKELVGACLISIWDSGPLVHDIAVRKGYQGKGIASNLLKYALSQLKDDYFYLLLFVTLGNTSESLYYNLNFRPGHKQTVFVYEKVEKK